MVNERMPELLSKINAVCADISVSLKFDNKENLFNEIQRLKDITDALEAYRVYGIVPSGRQGKNKGDNPGDYLDHEGYFRDKHGQLYGTSGTAGHVWNPTF